MNLQENERRARATKLRLGQTLANWLSPGLLMALIFWLSSQPALGAVGWFYAMAVRLFGDTPASDWLLPLAARFDPYAAWFGHFTMYGLLALAFYQAIRRQWPALARPYLWAWGVTVLYGATDEIHQHFVPGRTAQLHDLLTDGLGAAAALGILWLVRRNRHPNSWP